ncbi:MAG: hypothetical protein ABGF52_02440 [Candidatus Asgardarchaeum sp.]|nr:hypothetical protein [Candidatus Odinarchaeota archaeon]
MPYKKRRVEREKVVRGILINDEDMARIESIISKSKFIIPTALANQLGIRVSIIKDILEDLEKRGKIKVYDKSRRIQIYVPVKQ